MSSFVEEGPLGILRHKSQGVIITFAPPIVRPLGRTILHISSKYEYTKVEEILPKSAKLKQNVNI